MIKTYEYQLPRNYFDNLYEKTHTFLTKGENVLVSAIYGCGSSIFLNLFLRLNKEGHLLENVYFYDPISNKIPLIKFVKDIQKKDKKQKTLVIRLFEKIENKKEVLENLHSLKQVNSKNITYLIFTDHTGFTKPDEYMGISTPFFNGRFFIGPFDTDNTKKLIEINSNYFGWNTPKESHGSIINLSGGIPRIVKHIARLMHEERNSIEDIEWFLKEPSIKFQLENMASIFRTERISNLIRLGLIDNDKKIKSYLLERYLENYKSEIITSLYPRLANLESELLSLLYDNKGQVITIDQIGDFMELNGRVFSPWAIYKLMSRLKIKIKNNFEIENLKGRGYILKLN